MVNLDKLIREAQEMKPLPASTVRLAAVISSQHAAIEDICEIIAYDQSLSLALLRAANSAAHATANGITRVHEAVFRLGAARVLALAMSVNTKGLLVQSIPAYGLGEAALWKHSVAAAVGAEALSNFATMTLPPETFTAALLHDLGKLVMSRFLSAFDLEMIERAQHEGGLDLLAAESQVLGVHHGELGGLVAQSWQLPESIVKGITYHHNPADGNDLVCDAVYMANRIAKCIELTDPVTAMDAGAMSRLGLPESRLHNLIIAAQSHFQIISARYNTA